ncbi:hypothetical protein KUTeg_011998 [Tegillarca granosa]|uniref:Transmembrane protein n=1 Tax=Tegillarca granosa TaxID=220873 RepID=A0ABQ9EYA6_TEGGR|nr:hypothetical protein KUTeg_011998 [Tegillarca granosa]
MEMLDDQEKGSASDNTESEKFVKEDVSQNGKIKFFRQTSKRAKLTEEQKWRSLAIIFIILDVLLLVITLTVVCVWVRDRGDQPLIPQASRVLSTKGGNLPSQRRR